MSDCVRYAVPGGLLLEGSVNGLLVRPDLERVFEYRRAALAGLFGAADP